MDLFGSFDKVINDDFLEGFEKYLDTNHANLNLGIKGIFYIFTAGLIRRSYSEMSSSMLFNQIKVNAENINLPENLSDLFNKPNQLADVEENGSKIISQLFPAYRSPMISTITTYSGMSKNATSTASRIVANVMVQLFNKEIDENNWTVEDMVGTLRRNHEPLLEIMPENFKELMIPSLGLQDLLKVKQYVPRKEKAREVRKTEEEEVKPATKESDYSDLNEKESNTTNWVVVGILVLVAALGGAFYYLKTNNPDFLKKKAIPVESTEIEEEFLEEDSLELERWNNYLSLKSYILDGEEAVGKEFNFDSIIFDSTTVSNDSEIVLDSLASLMESNPNMQIKITANKPNENNNFKIGRAFSIKKLLMERGVNEIRMDPTAGSEETEKLVIKVVKK